MSSAWVGHQISLNRSSNRVRKGSPAVHRAQQINSQASNWNTGNILLLESTRSYPTIPPSRSFAEIRVVLPVWLHDWCCTCAGSWSAGKLAVAGWCWLAMVKVNAPLRPGFLHNCCWRNYAGPRQRAESSTGEQIWIVTAGGELPAQCQPSPHRGILTLMRNMQYIELLYAYTFWSLFSNFAPHPIRQNENAAISSLQNLFPHH